MAPLMLTRKKKLEMMMDSIQTILDVGLLYYIYFFSYVEQYYNSCTLSSSNRFERTIARFGVMQKVVYNSDKDCIAQLRVNRHTFVVLCHMLRSVGELENTRHCDVEEMVAMFLYVLAHHFKNRVIGNLFMRSGETISKHVNMVLKGVIRLQGHLLKQPEAVAENSTNHRWKWFKNCLRALDGTYIRIKVAAADKPRYRTRKNEIATNILGVCSQNIEFIFVYPGWEGSAADSRVLREAVCRRNGLKVPHGYYYLVDAGYPNSGGFLASFRGQRYHLNEWREGHQPTTPEELFIMKHSKARNVIGRAFGLLKLRWAILRSPSWYPVKIHCRFIMACCLIHNLIRREMPLDPVLESMGGEEDDNEKNSDLVVPQGPPIDYVDSSEQWSIKRRELANQMWEELTASRHMNDGN